MNCAELETLICDYVDGTLAPAAKAEVESHLAGCPACAELARDSAVAVAFMASAAEVEPPAELVTRILFEAPWTKGKPKSKMRVWVSAMLSPILQPRFAMGMAMTILSLAMLAQFVVPLRTLKRSDLEPAKVWADLVERADRARIRTVMFYENLKFVYQIQTTLREWQQQNNEEQQSAPDQDAPGRKTDERKLPVRPAPNQNVPRGASPAINRPGGLG